MGLLTDRSWGGEARTLPPAPAGQQQEVAPVGRYELLTDLQVGGRGTLFRYRGLCASGLCMGSLHAVTLLTSASCCVVPPAGSNSSPTPLPRRALRTSWVTWTSRWQVRAACASWVHLRPNKRCCGFGARHKAIALPTDPVVHMAAMQHQCRPPTPPTHCVLHPLAGTRAGITAAQLDVKLPGGVPLDIVEEAVHAAARGRAQLLTIMEQAVPKVGGWTLPRPVWLWAMHRPIGKQGGHGSAGRCSGGAHPLLPILPWSVQERPASAPQHGSVRVPEGMLGRVIGSGGATVKEVEETFDARIDIHDSGGCRGCRGCAWIAMGGLRLRAGQGHRVRWTGPGL